MLRRTLRIGFGCLLALSVMTGLNPRLQAAEVQLPPGVKLEEVPTNAAAAKVVFIAGSNRFRPGEHEYIAGCAVLMDLLKQTSGVAPVLAIDWPQRPETFQNARAIVFFADGGEKHTLLKEDRMGQLQKLAEAGVGLVFFHQGVDISKELGDRMRTWSGAAWEKGYSQRAHWIDEFKGLPEHPITRGVEQFKIDDGWLTKLRFVPEMRGISPLLRTVSPKLPTAERKLDDTAIVAWSYDRPDGGRSFSFTGCHLHVSLAQASYRRFLTNGILWSAKVDLPATGAPVELSETDLNKYLAR